MAGEKGRVKIIINQTKMTKIEVLKIQIESDKRMLKEDTDAGLYKGNVAALNAELERIRHKEVLLEDLLEQERILNEEDTADEPRIAGEEAEMTAL